MKENWTDSELLLKIKEDKELWSALSDLAELYKTDSEKAKGIIEDIICLMKNVKTDQKCF